MCGWEDRRNVDLGLEEETDGRCKKSTGGGGNNTDTLIYSPIKFS